MPLVRETGPGGDLDESKIGGGKEGFARIQTDTLLMLTVAARATVTLQCPEAVLISTA